jgi:hypothetical protein
MNDISVISQTQGGVMSEVTKAELFTIEPKIVPENKATDGR